MRLVLANAILGAALTWAVLHERPSPLPDPATAEVIERPAGSASDDRDTPLAAPLAGRPEPRPTDAVPAGPPSAAASPIERAEAPPSLVAEPPAATPDAGAAEAGPPAFGARQADGTPALASRAERLAALDALVADMESFALHRRR